MPVILIKQIRPDLNFGIWKIIEEQEHLESMYGLSPTEKEKLYSFKFIGRRLEWLASRLMLKELNDEEKSIPIAKDKFGKPFIKGSHWKISIAHTFGYAAAGLGENLSSLGLDIELISNKAYRVKDKFLSKEEQDLLKQLNAEEEEIFTLAWCAKEAVYKMYGRKEVDFKEHMQIIEVSYSNGKAFNIQLSKDGNELIEVFYDRMEDLLIAWCEKKS